MLEITARDGAGRTTELRVGQRKISTPAVLWLEEDLPPTGGTWGPLLSRRTSPGALVTATTRFDQEAPAVVAGQILVQRRLRPTASMMEATHDGLEVLPEGVAIWGHAYDLLKDPKRFVPALARAREAAGPQRALYAPGLGEPHTLALLVYAGMDVFDATPLHYAAAQGNYLTSHGRLDARNVTENECLCDSCRGRPPIDLEPNDLAQHNQYVARQELGIVRNALREGRLRELVEARVRSHPEVTGLLRRLDAEYDYMEARSAVNRGAPLWAATKESLQRVECSRFRRRVQERYRPPTAPPVLLLLPCSHRKPYSTSRTHRAFGDSIWAAGAAGLVHEVVLTSPLGMVPRELELCYPAQHYDVPVTGEWDAEEAAMIRDLLAGLFAKRSYQRVVSHLPRRTYDLVRTLLPSDTLVTCEGENATAPEALKRLELTLRKLAAEHRRADLSRLLLERLRSISDYQFGPAATDRLFEGTAARGKWPTGQVVSGGRQLAMLPTDRGFLSLTLDGARRLLEAGRHRVEIDDFEVKGSVFAVGVKAADPEIRPGDEVVLHHAGRIKGVGVATMAGPEMAILRRGEAVKVRHHA